MMRRLSILWGMALLALTAVALALPAAALGQTSVTGAGAALFPAGAEYEGLTLSGATFGHGLVINADGSATGDFQTDLQGTTLLGVGREITVEGLVTTGAFHPDGSVTFAGTSSVDLGDGTLALSGVPFSVTVSPQGLTLGLGTTSLPPQTPSAGQINIIPE